MMRMTLKKLKKYYKVRYLFSGVLSIVILLVVALGLLRIITYKNPIEDKMAREVINTSNKIVNDVTELNPVHVVDIVVPHSTDDVVMYVKQYPHVSIGGGRNSMGGQTASEKAVQLDMREFNKIIDFSTTTKEITVQSGIRWRDIQDYIDPYNLSVKIMQTYSNFTVGGSLSVNVHGRYIGLGPIILSVKKFTIVLADGTIVVATPTENPEIFYSAIGGMGGIGVITDVTLSLADNVNVERSQKLLSTGEYLSFFRNTVRDDKKVIFHNGDMYPPNFDHISAVSWSETIKEPTTVDRLIPRKQDYWLERMAWVIMSEWPKGRWIREYVIDPLVYHGAPPVHTRNYEASYDVAELEPESRSSSSYVLQEYFVPVERFDEWVPKMKKVFNDNNVNVINVSIRHALPDTGAKLAWAKTESFAFVVYYKQDTDQKSRDEVALWTRQMIDQVLSVKGAYYLPYQPHATDDQFHHAYPHAVEYFEMKKKYDPTNKFTNKLWDKYYSEEKLEYYKDRERVLSVASTTVDYARPEDNMYLSIPEWFIVYNSNEYARTLQGGLPSQFRYFNAIREYWKQYHTVVELTKESSHDNHDYINVLRVIGISYSVENCFKGIYENTIGRVTEWFAGNVQVYEDKVAGRMAHDYGVFIYDYPWYDFPYFSYLSVLWSKSDTTGTTLGQYLRKGERLVIVSVEILIKSAYSKLIAYVTHQKFGVQDDSIGAVVTHDGAKTTELVSAPHYQPFTRKMIEEMNYSFNAKAGFSVLDIAGNDSIVISYIDATGAPVPSNLTELVRTPEDFFVSYRKIEKKERIHAKVYVKDLYNVYTILRERGVAIDHMYDY